MTLDDRLKEDLEPLSMKSFGEAIIIIGLVYYTVGYELFLISRKIFDYFKKYL